MSTCSLLLVQHSSSSPPTGTLASSPRPRPRLTRARFGSRQTPRQFSSHKLRLTSRSFSPRLEAWPRGRVCTRFLSLIRASRRALRFTLDSLDLWLVPGNLKGVFRVMVAYYDEKWRKVRMGDSVDILSGDVVIAVGSGGIYKIDFIGIGSPFVFQGGSQE